MSKKKTKLSLDKINQVVKTPGRLKQKIIKTTKCLKKNIFERAEFFRK